MGLITLMMMMIAMVHGTNVVFFLVDDLGYGDLSNTTITPNIARLAKAGVKLESHLTQAMCTPSRTSLLTGRYAVRSGMASSRSAFRVLNSAAHPGGLPSWTTTIAEALTATHPRRALFGKVMFPLKHHCCKSHSLVLIFKWHLGITEEHLPLQHGFQEYWGMPVTNVQRCGGKGKNDHHQWHNAIFIWRQSMSSWMSLLVIIALFFRQHWKFTLPLSIALMLVIWLAPATFTLMNQSHCVLFDGNLLVEQPVRLENLTWRLVERTKRFIRTSVGEKKPFFAMVSFHKVHTALFNAPGFVGRMETPYQDNVFEMDSAVGAILQELSGILDDTLVIFASDNGPFLEHGQEAGSSGPLRGGKGQVWEGGVRVPAIVSWPAGGVAQGTTLAAPTSMCDWFPTILDAVGAALPPGLLLDGISLLPQLVQNQTTSERFIVHYCGDKVGALRMGRFKMILRSPRWDVGRDCCPSRVICGCSDDQSLLHDPPLLFDLSSDVGEANPINGGHEEIRAKMLHLFKEHEASIVPVENQLEHLFRPWLHPCCNFPWCSCVEKE